MVELQRQLLAQPAHRRAALFEQLLKGAVVPVFGLLELLLPVVKQGFSPRALKNGLEAVAAVAEGPEVVTTV